MMAATPGPIVRALSPVMFCDVRLNPCLCGNGLCEPVHPPTTDGSNIYSINELGRVRFTKFVGNQEFREIRIQIPPYSVFSSMRYGIGMLVNSIEISYLLEFTKFSNLRRKVDKNRQNVLTLAHPSSPPPPPHTKKCCKIILCFFRENKLTLVLIH